MNCGTKDENGDICGETFTCGRCRDSLHIEKLSRIIESRMEADAVWAEAARVALAAEEAWKAAEKTWKALADLAAAAEAKAEAAADVAAWQALGAEWAKSQRDETEI